MPLLCPPHFQKVMQSFSCRPLSLSTMGTCSRCQQVHGWHPVPHLDPAVWLVKDPRNTEDSSTMTTCLVTLTIWGFATYKLCGEFLSPQPQPREGPSFTHGHTESGTASTGSQGSQAGAAHGLGSVCRQALLS